VNVSQINARLQSGEISAPGVFPHLDGLARAPFVFRVDFGLDGLPSEPGVLLIRGAGRMRGLTVEDLLLDETW
jgi:hypothetical protein